MLPFYVTVKRTQIPKDDKFQQLRIKMSETVYFQDSAVNKAEMIPVSTIYDKVKKE
jgi:hypothetical protein